METNTVESNVTVRGATQSTSRTYLSSSRSYATTNFQLPTVNSFLTPSTLRETPEASRGPRDISDAELIELYARMERLKLQANSLYGPPPAQPAPPTQPPGPNSSAAHTASAWVGTVPGPQSAVAPDSQGSVLPGLQGTPAVYTQPLLQRGQSLAGAITLATIMPSAALSQSVIQVPVSAQVVIPPATRMHDLGRNRFRQSTTWKSTRKGRANSLSTVCT